MRKTLFVFSAFFVLISATYSSTKMISLDRVRWKSKWCVWKDHNDYPEWKKQRIWTENRKKTYIGKYWEPAKKNVKNMIILIAGQQGFAGLSGASNSLTGQADKWDNSFGKGDKSRKLPLNDLSLTSCIVDSGLFNSSDTFLAVVFNANFNWENSSSNKKKVEKAFTKWFLKHGEYSKVKKIFLFGGSRGGVLAMRMSKRIRKDGWLDTPIYIGLIDAVPNREQNELETNDGEKYTNPLNSDKYARYADLYKFYKYGYYPAPLKIKHQLTGSGVILGSLCHAFCFDENSGFYEQEWSDLSHTQIGRCVDKEGEDYQQEYLEAGVIPLMDWINEIMTN